jgi:uncharacterized protein YjiS (DUF1127 family)
VTTLALTSRHPNAALTTSPIARAAVAAARWIYRWQKIRADRALLQAMPDSLLSDIGIGRSSIEHATEFGRGFG